MPTNSKISSFYSRRKNTNAVNKVVSNKCYRLGCNTFMQYFFSEYRAKCIVWSEILGCPIINFYLHRHTLGIYFKLAF